MNGSILKNCFVVSFFLLWAASAFADIEPNNICSQAETVSFDTDYWGQVQLNNDTLDIYKITISQSGTLSVTASAENNRTFRLVINDQCDYNSLLYDQTANIHSAEITISTTGTYYLGFHPNNNDIQYTFSLTMTGGEPVIDDAATTVIENAPNGTLVYDVNDSNTGNDTDQDGDSLSYSITAGNGDGVFTIDANTGQITIADNSNLDYGTTSQYTLTIQASDGSLFDTADITIDVLKLLAEYRFDECQYTGSGFEAIDETGTYNARAENGVNTNTPGIVGRYADLQSNMHSFRPSSAIPLTSSWSVSVWFRMPFISTQRYHTLGAMAGGNDLMFVDRFSNYRWGVYTATPSYQEINGTFRFGTLADGWHHMVLVGSSGSTSLYIDGNFQDSVPLQSNGQLDFIGTSYDYYGTAFALGFGLPLDEFIVYNQALSASFINFMYTNQLAGNNLDGTTRMPHPCNLVAEYRMDECSWDGSVGEVTDSSGNGYNGSSINDPATNRDSPATGDVNTGTCSYGVFRI